MLALSCCPSAGCWILWKSSTKATKVKVNWNMEKKGLISLYTISFHLLSNIVKGRFLALCNLCHLHNKEDENVLNFIFSLENFLLKKIKNCFFIIKNMLYCLSVIVMTLKVRCSENIGHPSKSPLVNLLGKLNLFFPYSNWP